jgi:hypothetical protein
MLAANADAQTRQSSVERRRVIRVSRSGGSLANSANGPGTGSAVGGHLPGALGIKAGDRVIELRRAASVGGDRGNFKAGLGIPF